MTNTIAETFEPAAPACCRSDRHRLPGLHRRRFRRHGGAADERHGAGAPRQHAADGRHPGRADHRPRPGLRRALQSGGDPRDAAQRRASRPPTARPTSPRRSPAASPGTLRRASDVRAAALRSFAHVRTGPGNGSPRRSPRSALSPRSSAGSVSAPRRSLAGRALHHGRLLVHRLHVLRQSGGRDRARLHRHVLRHPAGRSSGLHRRATPRRYLRCGLRRVVIEATGGSFKAYMIGPPPHAAR